MSTKPEPDERASFLTRSLQRTQAAALVVVDVEADELVILGVRYSIEAFRRMALAEPGTWLRVAARDGDGRGTIHVRSFPDSTERALDAMVGLGRSGTGA